MSTNARVAPSRSAGTARELQPAPVVLPRHGVGVGLFVVLGAPVLLVVLGAPLIAISAALGAVLIVLGLLLIASNVALGGSRRLLASLGGRSVGATEEPRLFNLLEGLCVANGLSVPEVRVIEAQGANALLVATRSGATLLCTSRLLSLLDRIELEGAVAHELATLKRGDAARASQIAVALGALATVSGLGARAAWRLQDADAKALCDQLAVSMTRYPPGLRKALAAIEADNRRVELSGAVARLTGAQWLVPLEKPGTARAGELDVEERQAVLAEL